MERKVHYATVSEAITALHEKGFTCDFNLEENCIITHPEKFGYDEFEIVDIYRYEGLTDPADESTVYAITSGSGLKGILVTAYGMATDCLTTQILEKLKRK